VVAVESIEIVIEGIVYSVCIGHVEGIAAYCGFLGTINIEIKEREYRR